MERVITMYRNIAFACYWFAACREFTWPASKCGIANGSVWKEQWNEVRPYSRGRSGDFTFRPQIRRATRDLLLVFDGLRIISRLRISSILCFVLLRASIVLSSAESFTVEGRIMAGFPRDHPSEIRNGSFKMSVGSSSNWWMRLELAATAADYIEIGTQLDDVYKVVSFESIAKEPGAKSKSSSNAEVIPGIVPLFPGTPEAIVVWMAFASPDYFINKPKGEFVPFHKVFSIYSEPHEQPVLFPAEWTIANGQQNCLMSFIMIEPGEYVVPTRPRFGNDSKRTIRHSGPFANGFKSAEFKTLVTTNLAGLLIPSEFLFETYQYGPEAKGVDDLAVVQRFHCQLDSVHLDRPQRPSYLPTIPLGGAHTVDKRFTARAGRITYSSESWKSRRDIEESPSLRVGEQREAIIAVGKQARKPWSRRNVLVGLSILFVVIGFPVAVYFRMNARKDV